MEQNKKKGEKDESVYSHLRMGIWFRMNHTDDSNGVGLQRIIVCTLLLLFIRILFMQAQQIQ